MSYIAYFISGHGYGHGVRSTTLINAMPKQWNVKIYSSLEGAFFKREIKRPFEYQNIELDCGAIQKDNQSVEEELSLITYGKINGNRNALIERIQNFLKEDKINLVLGDIPPLCFQAARNLGIISIALANFTWCDIYEPYLKNFPQYSPLLSQMEEDYNQANASLLLTPHMACRGLLNRQTMPLLAKGILGNKEEYAAALGIPENKHWALMYLGHQGAGKQNWKRLEEYQDWIFLGLYPMENPAANYHFIKIPQSLSYSGLLSSCQMVLGKLGYGLIGEVLCHKTPLVYSSRSGFAEFETLKDYLSAFKISRELVEEDFQKLSLAKYLDWALNLKPAYASVDFGAKACLKAIHSFLG